MTIEQLLTTHFPDDPVLDAALATALLRRTAREPNAPALIRIYSPARTLSFGRLDAVRPQFPAAAAAARRHGFTPVVRGAGGRAAAYHEQTLVVEMFSRDTEGMVGARPRFQRITPRLVGVLRKLGVDARIGPVPGEYCPGDWTVNGAGRVKLAGTAQRIVAGAWLFGFELVVSDSDPVRAVLTDVNAALELEFDPGTAASLTDLNPAVTLEQVRAAILAEIGVVRERTADPDLLEEAANLRDAHVA
ncbi:lipoate-protein ligase A [Rhodococcus opacus M213]|uniref:Lipoate-protein ligase A n=1 Tax=Rhodococcus opacus M213 TaxID=1129896 RepID=K8XL96_RHOOP|nr:lipoate--protein ligase family protein [Rhodococcus opacus]EKT82184.1 lipoate-protein ligase A [Rhodococcus opacus M213]